MEENFKFRNFKKPDDKLDKVSKMILALSRLLENCFDPILRGTNLDFPRFSNFIDSGAIHFRLNDILSKRNLFVSDSEIISIILQEFDIFVSVISKEYPPNIHDQLLSSWYSFKKSDVSKLLSQELVRGALEGQPNSLSNTLTKKSNSEVHKTNETFYEQDSSFVFLINKDELTLFCKNLLEYIKNGLKTNSYDFENYLIYNQNSNLNLEYLLSEQFLSYLMNLSNIKDEKYYRNIESHNRTQARRCLEVIVFALIKSKDYSELRLKLVEYTGLSKTQISRDIKRFIPLLSSFNPNFDVSNWLPAEPKTPITYNDILNLIAPYGHIIKTSEKEFFERAKKDGTSPSKTYFELICHDCNNSFFTSWSNIKDCSDKTNKCPHCAGNVPITFKDILDLAKFRNWTVLSTEKEFLENKEKYRSNPSKTKFLIRCENGYIFPYTYNYLQEYSDCQYCNGNLPISYNDLKQEVEIRNGILITTPEEFEFNKRIYNTTPSITKVKILCLNNHTFNSCWSYIVNGNNWCPYCSSGKFENIIRWYLNKIFTYIISQHSQSQTITFSKYNLKDLNMLENTSLYVGRMQYDGYEQINWLYNYVLKFPLNSFQNKQIYKKIYKIENFYNIGVQDFLNVFEQDYNSNLFLNGDKILISLPFGEIELIVGPENLKLLDYSLFLSSYEIFNLNILKIAFEYDGYQHYLYPNGHHDTIYKFLVQIINDLHKKKLSFENNIFLLNFPYFINPRLNDPKAIQEYLIKTLEKFTNINFSEYKIPQFNHFSKEAFKDILSYENNQD